MLFIGRRGQPFFWSPFENEAGNHNVAICGKSGSGKSVLLQEMCAALRGAGAKVVVIDDGRSFEHSVKLQGGRFVEFTMKAGFCLNPFSMIDAVRADEDDEVAVGGEWGSGKWGRLQGVGAARRGAVAKVVVIDDGRSFEHSVKLQGGRFVEFTMKAGFCLNPFSMIDAVRADEDDDYRLDCFGMVKAIVGQMARHSAALTDTGPGLIYRRSEERPVGKECVRTGQSRGSP